MPGFTELHPFIKKPPLLYSEINYIEEIFFFLRSYLSYIISLFCPGSNYSTIQKKNHSCINFRKKNQELKINIYLQEILISSSCVFKTEAK